MYTIFHGNICYNMCVHTVLDMVNVLEENYFFFKQNSCFLRGTFLWTCEMIEILKDWILFWNFLNWSAPRIVHLFTNQRLMTDKYDTFHHSTNWPRIKRKHFVKHLWVSTCKIKAYTHHHLRVERFWNQIRKNKFGFL